MEERREEPLALMKILIIASLFLYIAGLVDLITLYTRGKRTSHRMATGLIAAGLLLHTLAILWRSYGAGRLPVVGMDETLIFYSWVTVGTTLLLIIRYGRIYVELLTLPIAFFALSLAAIMLKEVRPLPLILQTYWFEVHVITSFVAYSLFTVGFSGALFYMVKRDWQGREDFLRVTRISVLWGFMCFSASMFSGAIWAYLAWGMYWMWEPKIIWSFILWFWYAGMLHLFYVKGMRERSICVTAIVGFFITLFTYLGVGLLMKSSHSF